MRENVSIVNEEVGVRNKQYLQIQNVYLKEILRIIREIFRREIEEKYFFFLKEYTFEHDIYPPLSFISHLLSFPNFFLRFLPFPFLFLSLLFFLHSLFPSFSLYLFYLHPLQFLFYFLYLFFKFFPFHIPFLFSNPPFFLDLFHLLL